MKLCNNCGSQMSDDSQFCINCGAAMQGEAAPQTQMPELELESPKPETKKKPGKKKTVLILCLVVLLIGAALAAYFWASWYFSPEQKVMRLLAEGKYDEALELVDDENLDRDDDFEEQLLKHLDEIKENFTQDKMAYSAATAELDAIGQMGIDKVNKKLPEYRAYVEELNTSRTCFNTAEKFYDSGEFASALELYRQVIKTDPNYDTAKSRISECTEKYRESALAEAAKYAENGAFSNAVAVLEAALEVLPGDADITSQKLLYEKDNLSQLKEEALDEAAAYAADKDYESAMAVLNKFTDEYGKDSDVSVKYNEYQEAYVDQVLEKVDGYQAQGDYPAALKALETGLTVAKNNSRLENRQTAVTKAYAEQVCADADALVSQKKYDEAITLIDEALKNVPGNTTLTNKKTAIEDAMPKCLLDVCKPYESSNYEEFINGRTFTMAGQDYTDGFKLRSDGYAIWNINGAYSTLEFDLGHIDDTDMGTVTVEIYLDGELYKTIKVNPESLPQHYTISIAGVKQLKIKAPYANWRYPYVGMGNMTVQ